MSSAKSRATVKRSLARRARAFRQIRSRSGEIVSSNNRGERTSSVATSSIRSHMFSERKGRRPVSSSYSTTPRLKMSLRLSMRCPSPRACSGLM